MAIKVKAVERELNVGASAGQYRYMLQADLYNKLSDVKVIQEASLRSGISKGAVNAAWDAIGEVIKAWATEGHSVAIPGLGTMRFGVRATSVADVNLVGTDLITARRVIFAPNQDIKDELRKTSINITCYDRNGMVVKRVLSTDNGDIEDPDNDTAAGGNEDSNQNSGNTPQGGDDDENPGGGSGNGSGNEGGSQGEY